MTTTLAFLALAFAQSNPTAIEHVDVIPAHRDVVLRDQTVFLEHGRILGLAPSAVTAVPDHFQSIDASGKYLVPGYVDSHAHFPGTSVEDIPIDLYLQMMVESGVTRLRCMRLNDALPLWAKKVQSGETLGPTLHYPVALFSSRENLERQHLEPVLRLAASKASPSGSPFVKMLGGFSPKTYRQLVELSRKLGIKVAGHLPHGVDLEMAAKAGQIGNEHYHRFERQQKLSMAELQRRLKISRQAGIFHCPTIFWNAVQGGHFHTDQLNALAGVDRLPQSVIQVWNDSMADAEQEHRRKSMEPNRSMMSGF